MWALFARDYKPRQWLLITLAAIAAIDAGLWFHAIRRSRGTWVPQARFMVWSAAGALTHLRRRDLDGWILAAFVIVKLCYEQGWARSLRYQWLRRGC